MKRLREFFKDIFRTKFIDRRNKDRLNDESKLLVKEDLDKRLDNMLDSIKESRENYRNYRIRLEVLNEILEEDPEYYTAEEIEVIIRN